MNQPYQPIRSPAGGNHIIYVWLAYTVWHADMRYSFSVSFSSDQICPLSRYIFVVVWCKNRAAHRGTTMWVWSILIADLDFDAHNSDTHTHVYVHMYVTLYTCNYVCFFYIHKSMLGIQPAAHDFGSSFNVFDLLAGTKESNLSDGGTKRGKEALKAMRYLAKLIFWFPKRYPSDVWGCVNKYLDDFPAHPNWIPPSGQTA